MLNDPRELGFDRVDDVGFTLRRTGADQHHAGFLFKSDEQVLVRRHCDHLDTGEEPAGHPDDLWTDIAAVAQTNKAIIAARLARIGGDKAPFGVGYRTQQGYLDKHALRCISTTPGHGLTCATYIVAILDTLGYPQFDHEN